MPYPGSEFTTISDKIKAFTTGPTTERLLIIGTSLDGPLNKPIPIRDAATAEKIFGPGTYSNGYLNPITSLSDDANAGASIPRAIAQALSSGCTDIYVCRATGTYATAASAFGSKLNMRSVYPGRIYNQVTLSLQVTGATLGVGGALNVTLAQPSLKGTSFTTTFASTLSIGDVIDRINGDRRNTTLEIVKDFYSTILASACVALATTALTACSLAGGTDGVAAPGEDYATSLDGYATKLTTTDTGTFDTLLGDRFRFNVAVLTGIHIDDQVVTSGTAKPGGGNWAAADEYQVTIATDFVQWLDSVSKNIGPCFGVIGTRPAGLRNNSDIIDYVNNSLLATAGGKYNAALRWNKCGYYLYTGWNRTDDIAGNVDLGQRLAVVAGPDVVYTDPKLGTYTDNFHVTYAGLLTTIPPERAPIFRPLPGILAYGTPFPAKYCNLLVEGVGYDSTTDTAGQGAYVCLTRNPRDSQGPLVVFDDCTAAARDDYMRNWQLVHLCNNVHLDLDNALAGFLGGPTDTAALAAMETVVQNILDGYVNSHALKGKRGQGYDFKITMSGTDQMLGIIRVFLELAPATALRKIYFVVAVRQTL